MISLFKRKVETATIEVVEEPTSKYPKEVEEIHHAFETAADKLLEEAKAVIDQSSNLNLDKVKRLSALGFKQANEVAKSQEIIKKVEFSQEQVALVERYRKQYPRNKFITKDQVIEICNKYGLVTANSSAYKGFVPEKNLQQIEAFDENYKCSQKQVYICEDGSYLDMTGTVIKGSPLGYFHFYNKFPNNSVNFEQPISREYAFQSNDGINFYGTGQVKGVTYNLTNEAKRFNINNKVEPFLICAPLKDMDVEGQILKNKVFFIPKLVKVEVPDPVVLHSVDGGYLVVTAWGDEANDPI
jgi:hypothetical protein